ncbi:MAG: alpha-amylase [Promethearchaeota archaeon]|nr:MAG: alpha-amylase [Candidatus Lokiarchaeota archaeon]
MSYNKLKWPKHPKILEINTWPWLNNLSGKYNDSINLNNVPQEIINNKFRNFDVIWLMGVWERSPQGREIALEDPYLQEEYHDALRKFKPEDVVGSPYSIHYYRVDDHLGGNDGLKAFRKQLIDSELLLILDYVPNHVAVDHMWTLLKSDVFIKGTEKDLLSHPKEFCKIVDQVYAHGKDPYFPPWGDTIQINAFSSEAREKSIYTLLEIAQLCDGIRCDMAMLMTNKIFSQTWGERAGPPPEEEFWVDIIKSIRKDYPNFTFLAEVYWNMEWELQQQGFDYCYDKKLHDRLIHDNAHSVREHLKADWDYQRKLIRFIENHDEKRAIKVLGESKSKAAAVIICTIPGAKLIYEGQMKGYKIKWPVQLGRRINEENNLELMGFYKNLIEATPSSEFEDGNWALCNIEQVNDADISNNNLIGYQWWSEDKYRVIIVNYSEFKSRGQVKIEKLNFGTYEWEFNDLLNQNIYRYNGQNLSMYGLYVELNPWNSHIFDLKRLN